MYMYVPKVNFTPPPLPLQEAKSIAYDDSLSLMTAYLFHQANGVNFLSSSLLSLLHFFPRAKLIILALAPAPAQAPTLQKKSVMYLLKSLHSFMHNSIIELPLHVLDR